MKSTTQIKSLSLLGWEVSSSHTSFERTIQQNKWTWSATCLGSFRTCLGFIFYIMENRTNGWFGGPMVHTGQKIHQIGQNGLCASTALSKMALWIILLFDNLNPVDIPVTKQVRIFCIFSPSELTLSTLGVPTSTIYMAHKYPNVLFQ